MDSMIAFIESIIVLVDSICLCKVATSDLTSLRALLLSLHLQF